MGFIKGDRSQIDMIGYSLDEFVEEDSMCRFVAKFVERLDLRILYDAYSGQGGDAFDPATLLTVWFLAYSEGQTSTRRVERLCRRDLHYIYASANLKPDHCSLSRFRQRHAEHLPELFAQVVRLAQAEGLAGFRRIAVDGSKIEAAASSRANRTKDALEKELAAVREDARTFLGECAGEDDCAQPSKLERKQERLEQAGAVLEDRSRNLSPANRKKHLVNLTDPDARNMAEVNGKRSHNAYNAQIAVDEDSGIIGCCSAGDEPNDRREFGRVHSACEKQLGPDRSRQYTADSGYHSFDQLEYIENHHVDAVIAEPRVRSRQASCDEGYFHRGAFGYDARRDCYICPAKERLEPVSREHKRGRLQFVYQCRACPACPLRARCLKNPDNPASLRKIVRDSKEHLAEAMLAKSRSPGGLERMKRRAHTVEPAFGNLKHNLGFRRFSLRGLEKVRGEFALMCIAHNLRKWRLLARFNPIDRPLFAFSFNTKALMARIYRSFAFLGHPSTLWRHFGC